MVLVALPRVEMLVTRAIFACCSPGRGQLTVSAERDVEESRQVSLADRLIGGAAYGPRRCGGRSRAGRSRVRQAGGRRPGRRQGNQARHVTSVEIPLGQRREAEYLLDGGRNRAVVVRPVVDQVSRDKRRHDDGGDTRAVLLEREAVLVHVAGPDDLVAR
jgi:hypothetical protein